MAMTPMAMAMSPMAMAPTMMGRKLQQMVSVFSVCEGLCL